MARWNYAIVLVLLIYLESYRSIESPVEKVFPVSTEQDKDETKSQDGCDLKEVYPLEVVSCDHRSTQPDKSEKEVQSTVAVGVQCAFKEYNSTVFVIKECNAHGWHDTDIYNAVPVSRDTVLHSHGGRVKRFLFAILAVVGLVSLFCCHHSHRDRTAPSISCPYVEPKLADPIQTSRIMYWKEPLAHDNEDGTITPQRGGPGPGVLFNEGPTYVKYYARDRAGNHKTCMVEVTVKVVRCPAISPMRDGYYVCHPSSDLVQGTSCYFGCYRGHNLSGYHTIECVGTIDKSYGHWNNPQPICEKLQCPVLPPAIKPMHMTCTDRNYYRSTCKFSCYPGYDTTPGQTRVMLCTENGSWRGAVPTCKDSEPPKFTKCIGYQVGYTEQGSDDGFIPTFESPEVTDNIAKNITLNLTSKIDPTSRLRRGVYIITYDAVDNAGNKASGCKIKLVIKMITCPRIYPSADVSVVCTAGSREGSHCEFACSSSAILNGKKDVTCERHNHDDYGYWAWQNQQPFCQDAKRCTEKLRAPDNGAIACDYWLGGSFCHMFCQHEYDVPRGESIDVNGMFVCGLSSGKWSPSAYVPNCAKLSNPKRHHYRVNVDFRFTGNCHDSDVVMEIQHKFIDTWKTSTFKEGCLHIIDKCIPSNVQVRCGGLTGKRSTTLSISFYIQMDTPFNVEGEKFANLTQQQYIAVQRLKKAIHNGRISIDLDNNSTLYATDLTYHTLEIECDGETVSTQNRQGCVKCVPGTFYQRDDKICISCPRGTYQPYEGHFTCRSCPNGTSTRLQGSTDKSNCEVACSPGSWSADGIPPCTYCPKGTYQDIYGGNECEICPNSTTTELDGATDVRHCIEFDAFLSSTNASFSKKFFTTPKANIIIKLWIKIEKTQTKNSLIELKIDGVQTIKLSLKDNHIVLGYNETEKSTSAKLLMKKWYTFMLKMSETELLVNIDGESVIINHEISLKEQNGKLTVGGFAGRISQLNIFDKDTELLPFKSCTNNAMGNILSWKDFEELVAPGIFIDVPSNCDDTNECDSNPCLNGNCIDELNGFSCQCLYGFYGDNCENNIDDCGDNACDNNGTCKDGAASYDCDCQSGFTGKLCEIKIVDGEWGEWGNWSSCSLTCGNGTMTRMRYCNSPTPDNGGSYCIGNHTEYETCMDVECLVCIQLFEPENTFLFCDNNTVTDIINCTLSCYPGFAFDHDPKDFYLCGPDTLHQWDIQTVENPLARLPSCTELKNASTLKIRYTASYSNLICDLSASSADAASAINDVVNAASEKTECILNRTCKVSVVEITNCTGHSREKRELTNVEAGFNIEYECDSKKYGSEKCHHMLLHAFESMVKQTSEKLLDSEIEDVVYPIDPSSLSVEDTVVCEAGMVPVDYRCVQCSKGRYEENGNCNLCDVGSYQDNTGSHRCNNCPDGRSTLGMGSTNADDCSVKQEMTKDVVNGMVIGLVCSFGLLLLIVVGFTLRRTLRKSPKIVDYTFNGANTGGFEAKAVFNLNELRTLKVKVKEVSNQK